MDRALRCSTALFALTLGLGLGSAAATAKPKTVTVKLKWDSEEFPAEMRVSELKSGATLPLWTTGSVKNAKDAPAGKEIPADTGIVLPPGGTKRLVLTMKNDTKKELFFFATPHTVAPGKHSLGFDFRCLCLNHAYRVPAGETWYRVVDLRLDPEFPAKEISVEHALVEVTKARAAQIHNKAAEVAPPKN